MKNLKELLFFVLFVIYEELVFSYLIFDIFPAQLLLIALFSISVAIILNILCGILKKGFNTVLAYLFTFLLCLVFSAQVVYYTLYESIISFYSLMSGGQVLQFIDTIFEVMKANWLGLLLLFIPFIFMTFLNICRILKFEKSTIKDSLLKLLIFAIIFALPISYITFSNNTDTYSNKNLYYNTHAPLLSVNKFGLITTMRLDFQRFIFKFEEKDIPLIEPTEKTIEIEENEVINYNILEIDFDELSQLETNKSIKTIHEYFAHQEASTKNQYTGMFEGKNLIVFVAEAFSQLAINETLTPNLYKLYSEGFQFDNFYTPVFPVSTADGEYIADTSLIPKEGVWSLSKIDGNYMPYSYANVFEKLGYSSRAYHNHTYNYYNRDKYIKTMGYDSYIATWSGLEKRMNTKLWPNSDYEMLDVTIPDYINDEHFISYYMTVSGHLNYTRSGNNMVARNWNAVKNLPYSDKAKSYLAANIEFDKAIGKLLFELEIAGKLEDTVIAISGDHYPYGLTLNEINELSTYTRDNSFEKYHMPFLVWSGSMTEPIKIDKIGSSLDILPTLLNLFGINYDSRLLIGSDILSDCSPLVIFSNRSFITDKGKYDSTKNSFIPFEDITVATDYVEIINSVISQKYKISRLILENDYYRILWNELDWNINE